MEEQRKEEQRKRERFEMSIPTDVLVKNSGNNSEFLKLIAVNISSGGAYLITDQKIPEGTPVKLDFVLPSNHSRDLTGAYGYVKITGTVLRTDEDGFAVSFNRSYKITPYKYQNIK
jgi:hypothetical protein